jgi:probable rRNA maturation factor
MNAIIDVSVEIVNASSTTQLPTATDFRHWTQATLTALAAAGDKLVPAQTELCIRVVDEAESAQLNENYRHKPGATNVLSFPVDSIQGTAINLLGDLAICAPLVIREAGEQDKAVQAHWAHLTVHGVLHLKGYDHEESAAAERMENLEIRILDSLGFGNPY